MRLRIKGATKIARGATKTAENMAQAQTGLADSALAGSQATAGQSLGQLMPQISQMLSPGGDPAVTSATMGALGSRFGAAKQDVADTAARTNNAASSNAATDKLALQEGSQAAQSAAGNVASQHENADKLLAQIYGQNTAIQPGLLGAGTNATNAYSNAIKTGGGVLGNLFNAVGGGIGAGIGAANS